MGGGGERGRTSNSINALAYIYILDAVCPSDTVTIVSPLGRGDQSKAGSQMFEDTKHRLYTKYERHANCYVREIDLFSYN